MSEDQFENRATFSKTRWALCGDLDKRVFYLTPSGFPILAETEDLAEAELLRLTRGREGAAGVAAVVEVVVTVIEKAKEDQG